MIQSIQPLTGRVMKTASKKFIDTWQKDNIAVQLMKNNPAEVNAEDHTICS